LSFFMKAIVDTGSIYASKAARISLDESCDAIWYLATGYRHELIFEPLAPIFLQYNVYAVLAAELESSSVIAEKLGRHKRAFGKLGMAAMNKRREMEVDLHIDDKLNFCDISSILCHEEVLTLFSAIYREWNALIFLSKTKLDETDKKEILGTIVKMYKASGTEFSKASSFKSFANVAKLLTSKKYLVALTGEDLSDTRCILIHGLPEQIIEFSELAKSLKQADADMTPTPKTREFLLKIPFSRRSTFQR